jgi:hypothetical protein
LVGITLSTALLWAAAELLTRSIGVWNKWNDSDFATIFRFIDTPFELMVQLGNTVGSWLGWFVRILLLPFEAGALVVSFVVGAVWEVLKFVWNGIMPSKKSS